MGGKAANHGVDDPRAPDFFFYFLVADEDRGRTFLLTILYWGWVLSAGEAAGLDRGRGTLKPDFSGFREPLGVRLPNSAFGDVTVVALHGPWRACPTAEIGRCYKSGLPVPLQEPMVKHLPAQHWTEGIPSPPLLPLGLPGEGCP